MRPQQTPRAHVSTVRGGPPIAPRNSPLLRRSSSGVLEVDPAAARVRKPRQAVHESSAPVRAPTGIAPALEVLDRRLHLCGVPLRPVVVAGQARRPGPPAFGHHADSSAMRTVTGRTRPGTVSSCQPSAGHRPSGGSQRWRLGAAIRLHLSIQTSGKHEPNGPAAGWRFLCFRGASRRARRRTPAPSPAAPPATRSAATP